jgi:hypothetical protein
MLVLYWVMVAAFLCCVCVGHCYQGIFVLQNVSGCNYYADIFWTEPKFCLWVSHVGSG